MKQGHIRLVQVLSAIFLLAVFVTPLVAGAAWRMPDATQGGTGLPNDARLSQFIINIINIALTIAGLVAVLFLIIGGFRYITSAGNEEVAGNAKKIITNAIIGIIIIILSFVIIRVISNALLGGVSGV